MASTKQKQVRVNITEEGEAVLSQLRLGIPLSDTAIISLILESGLKAIRENGHEFRMPLKLTIPGAPPTSYRLNEELPAKARK